MVLTFVAQCPLPRESQMGKFAIYSTVGVIGSLAGVSLYFYWKYKSLEEKHMKSQLQLAKLQSEQLNMWQIGVKLSLGAVGLGICYVAYCRVRSFFHNQFN